MKRRDKQLFILLGILIVLLIVGISVLINIFGKSDGDEEDSNYADMTVTIDDRVEGKYEPGVINGEYIRLENEDIPLLDQTIDYVLDCINNKDYTKLYEMVSEDYRTLKYADIETFKNYIDDTFKNAPYTCLSYRLYMEANYIKLQGNDGETMELKLFPFNGIEDTEIILDNLSTLKEISTSIKNSGITYNMKAVAKYEDNMSVFFEVINKTDEDVEIILENIKLATIIRGVEEKIVSNNSHKTTIKANETKMVEVYLNTEEKLYYALDSISLDITTSGNKRTVKQYIQYNNEEF